MAEERIEITKYSDLGKLASRYPRLLKVILAVQELSGGRIGTRYVVWERNEGDGQYPGHGSGTSQWDDKYMTTYISDANNLVHSVKRAKTIAGWDYTDTWGGWTNKANGGLKEYMALKAGRATHVYGIAVLREKKAKAKPVTAPAKSEPDKTPTATTHRGRLKMAKKLLDDGKLKPGHVARMGIARQTPPAPKSKRIDRARVAMLPGYRVSAAGNLYYEARENRSDTPLERRDQSYIRSQRRRQAVGARLHDRYKPRRDTLKIIPYDDVFNDAKKKHDIVFLPDDKIKRDKVLTVREQMQVVKTMFRKTHKLPIEYAFAVDKYGNIRYVSKGDAGKCMNPGEWWWDKHRDDRIFQCHNHPGYTPSNNWHGVSSTFSRGDFRSGEAMKPARMCVTGYDGTIHCLAHVGGRYPTSTTLLDIYTKVSKYAVEQSQKDKRYKTVHDNWIDTIKNHSKNHKSITELDALQEEVEHVRLQLFVEYAVKEYTKEFAQYEGGKVLKWIEDHV